MANGLLTHHEQQQHYIEELRVMVVTAQKATAEMQKEREQLDEARKASELEREALKKAKEEAEQAIAQLKEERRLREEASVANHEVITKGCKELRQELLKLISLAQSK